MTPLDAEKAFLVEPSLSMFRNTQVGTGVKIWGFTNIYDSKLGDDVFVGPFVEIGGAVIGDRTRISSHSYVCNNIEIGSDCFVAHGVAFCNDAFTAPAEYNHISEMQKEWKLKKTTVGNCVRIGSGAVIMAGITIGDHSVIGAGAVVTRNVGKCEIVAGVPARLIDTTSNPWEQFS